MTEKRMFLIASGILCVLGLVAFISGWIQTRADLVQGGGAVSAASLVAIATGIGLTTWADERRRVRVEKQQAVYTDLLEHLMSRFAGPGAYVSAHEAALRAQVSIWGSRAVVKGLGRWNEAFDEVVPAQSSPATHVPLSASASARMKTATAEVATAVRVGIDPDDATQVTEVVDALFNNLERSQQANQG
jgi:biotin carboxylase